MKKLKVFLCVIGGKIFNQGIHWCGWEKLCNLKEDGGLGFWQLTKFNIALLAK